MNKVLLVSVLLALVVWVAAQFRAINVYDDTHLFSVYCRQDGIVIRWTPTLRPAGYVGYVDLWLDGAYGGGEQRLPYARLEVNAYREFEGFMPYWLLTLLPAMLLLYRWARRLHRRRMRGFEVQPAGAAQ